MLLERVGNASTSGQDNALLDRAQHRGAISYPDVARPTSEHAEAISAISKGWHIWSD